VIAVTVPSVSGLVAVVTVIPVTFSNDAINVRFIAPRLLSPQSFGKPTNELHAGIFSNFIG
jgi:hypothetical protein